ncbi:MAG TPA: NUDIX domain-containing protein [Polyangiaceae bacterium]|jgi:ADP-ribose pyrophosphatase YjhB (NUDIX family)|nr:NUDIX domain-containing protein [Polyangiaceae bacterium]
MSERKRPIVTVGAVIERADGKILLVRTHKWHGRLGVPGGKVEYGETQEAALIREFREETALDIFEIRFLLAQDAIDSPEFYKPAHMILLNYSARTRETERLVLNDEAQALYWVTPSEALALDLTSFTRKLVEAFLESRARSSNSS